MPRRYNNYQVQVGGSPLPGLMDFDTYMQQQEAYKQRLALQQQRQQATQSRQEIQQREAMNRALLMQQIRQQEARQARQEKYPFAEFQSGLSNQNSAAQQSRASQYAQILERVRTGEIGLRDAQKIMLELGALPEQERIKRESAVTQAQQMVPIEVQKARQTQEATGPLKTKEAVAEAEGRARVYNSATDPWDKQLDKLNTSMMNLKNLIAGATGERKNLGLNIQMWKQELSNAATNSNNPRVKQMLQDIMEVSEGKPSDFRKNLDTAMGTFLFPDSGNVYDTLIDPLKAKLVETAGGQGSFDRRQQFISDEKNKQMMGPLPGPQDSSQWAPTDVSEFKGMRPLPTPAPGRGSQLDQNEMPWLKTAPLAELSPENVWTQRRDAIAGRSQDRNNVLASLAPQSMEPDFSSLGPTAPLPQAPQPQPDFSSLTATGQPPEKSDTYYKMLAYMQAEEEKKQRELDGRPPYDQWAEAPQDQFVPGYSSLEG